MSFTAFDVPDEIKDYAESGGKEGIVDWNQIIVVCWK